MTQIDKDAKDFCTYLNRKDFFESCFNSHPQIEIDCDRVFLISGNYGEILKLHPTFDTVSCVFMYEQGWSWYHTFAEIIFE